MFQGGRNRLGNRRFQGDVRIGVSAMKQKSRKLVRELAEKNAKASLIALWADLSSLSKEEFVGELDGIFGEKHAIGAAPKFKKAVAPPRKISSDDRPVTRIVFVLHDEKKLSNIEARSLLIESLLARGYGEEDIPNPNRKSLEEWLEELILHISSSDVMDAAKKLR
jgi:hypothetical protein